MSNDELKVLERRQADLQAKRRALDEKLKALKADRAQRIVQGDAETAAKLDDEIRDVTNQIEIVSIAGDSAVASLRRARAAAFRAHAEGVLSRLAAREQELGDILSRHVAALRKETGGIFDDLRGLPQQCMDATGVGYPIFDERFLASLDNTLARSFALAFAGVGVAVDVQLVRTGIKDMIQRARDAEKRAADSEEDAARRARDYGESRQQQTIAIINAGQEVQVPPALKRSEGDPEVLSWRQ
jgi:hypothetical protein